MPEEWRKLGKYFRIKAGFGPAFFQGNGSKKTYRHKFLLKCKKKCSQLHGHTLRLADYSFGHAEQKQHNRVLEKPS